LPRTGRYGQASLRARRTPFPALGGFLSTGIHTTCGFSFAIAAKGCFESEQLGDSILFTAAGDR
jgi:hypothetical protein